MPNTKTTKSDINKKYTNKSFLILLTTLGLLFIGTFAILTPSKDNSKGIHLPEVIKIKTEDEFVGATRIYYTEYGFDPQSVNISVGDEVIFINNSNRSMWVASNPHPTHNKYPDLNDDGGIGPNEEFRVVFDKKGEYGFHDHLRPNIEGKVIVN